MLRSWSWRCSDASAVRWQFASRPRRRWEVAWLLKQAIWPSADPRSYTLREWGTKEQRSSRWLRIRDAWPCPIVGQDAKAKAARDAGARGGARTVPRLRPVGIYFGQVTKARGHISVLSLGCIVISEHQWNLTISATTRDSPCVAPINDAKASVALCFVVSHDYLSLPVDC